MKKLKYYLIFFVVFLFSISCNDFLSDVNPSDQLPLEQVFNSGDDLEAALVGAYDLIQQGKVMGGNIPALPDLMGFNAFGWFEEVSSLQMEATHWVPEDIWPQSYSAINQVNAVLDALPRVIEQDATLKSEEADRIEGEALFIRGVLHFELVRLFALPWSHNPDTDPGIPILLEPVLTKEALHFPARATVKDVYEQAINDLEKAQKKLPQENIQGRATIYAASAYLARIAFQKEEYDNADSLANEILERDDLFWLTQTPQDFFIGEGSNEEIWVIFSSGMNDPIDGGLSSVYNDAPTTASISDDLREKGYKAIVTLNQQIKVQNAGYMVVDLRCDPDNIHSNGDLLVLQDTTRCHKYEHGWTEGEDDAPTARLAEFILMRAEALARIEGMNQESIDLLNKIRDRSLRVIDLNGNEVAKDLVLFEMGDFSGGVEELIEAIILERRVELAFEGNYLHDLMRLKRDVKNGNLVYPYDTTKLRLPIPQREIDVNPNLVQNPGY